MMGEKTIFLCEDSVDGIFTGVYDAWDSRLGHENVKLALKGEANYELFASYREVETDREKAEKVANTLRRRLGSEDYYHIYQAALSRDGRKAAAIYRTVAAGLAGRRSGSVMQYLQNPDICRVFELSRTTGNEAHRYYQFLRFRELESGVLFSEIKPENDVLPLIGEHFSDRFPGEHFLVYDRTHHTFLVHEAYKQWALVTGEELNREAIGKISEDEAQFAVLWKGFCRSVAIMERKNLRLQQQFLPMKFRAFMTEMSEDDGDL